LSDSSRSVGFWYRKAYALLAFSVGFVWRMSVQGNNQWQVTLPPARTGVWGAVERKTGL